MLICSRNVIKLSIFLRYFVKFYIDIVQWDLIRLFEDFRTSARKMNAFDAAMLIRYYYFPVGEEGKGARKGWNLILVFPLHVYRLCLVVHVYIFSSTSHLCTSVVENEGKSFQVWENSPFFGTLRSVGSVGWAERAKTKLFSTHINQIERPMWKTRTIQVDDLCLVRFNDGCSFSRIEKYTEKMAKSFHDRLSYGGGDGR